MRENNWWVRLMYLKTKIQIDLSSKPSLKLLTCSVKNKKKKLVWQTKFINRNLSSNTLISNYYLLNKDCSMHKKVWILQTLQSKCLLQWDKKSKKIENYLQWGLQLKLVKRKKSLNKLKSCYLSHLSLRVSFHILIINSLCWEEVIIHYYF